LWQLIGAYTMDESQKVTFLEKFQYSQQREIVVFTLFSAIIMGIGILLIIFSNAIANWLSVDQKSFVAIGGTFFSSLSGFPIMTIFKKKSKITAIEFLIGEFKRLQTGGENSKNSSPDFLQERFTKLLDAALGG
jgi:uncharacterized membrane protein